LGFARTSLFARESTGELDAESMGEVGEDAILEVHSRGGVAVAMPSLLIWFGLQGLLAYSCHYLGAEYAGYILANPPFLYNRGLTAA
jgi:hypothetical protein